MARESATRVNRPQRTPINGRNILSVSGKDPAYVYRVVNNVGDRIEVFKEAGYELVPASDVKVGERRVDAASPEGSYAQVSVDSQGTKAFIMRIPREWYEEDQRTKQKQVDELERTIKNEALSKNELRGGTLEISRD